MEYKLLVAPAGGAFRTNFDKAADRLADLVNQHVREGWTPQGGVAVGGTQSTKEPYLMQAIVRS